MRTVVENTNEKVYFETLDPIQSGISITLEVLDSSGSTVLSTPMSEVATSGIYFADINLTTPGDYIMRFVSANLSIVCNDHIKVIATATDINTLLTQILADIMQLSADLGEVDVCVKLIKKGFFNRMKIDETTNELILYDDDSTTELLKFELKDINGIATSANIYEVLKGVI